MNELSLHILDIINNSVKAGASIILVNVTEDIKNDILEIIISDNGSGMDEDFLKNVLDPFKTTRTTRKVGLGLSLFSAAAQQAGGSFKVESEKGVGTKVYASFKHSHIDRQPLGDVSSTITTVLSGNESLDIVYTYTYSSKSFVMDTREIRKILGDGVSIASPEIIMWIKDYINEGANEVRS